MRSISLIPPKAPPSLLMIVVIASLIMFISLGLRQCLGLFLQPVTADLGVSAAGFGLAFALHNLTWGLSQPFVGALADRWGTRPVVAICGLIYAAGLALMAGSRHAFVGLDLGMGLLTGLGIAGTGFGVLLGAVSRAARPERRSQVLGLVSGLGSAGVLVLAPLGQRLIDHWDWRLAAATYAIVVLATVPLALFLGRPGVAPVDNPTDARGGVATAAREALSHGGFVAMTVAFFACGLQLMFITVHLPRFLSLCGMPPALGATALGIIGLCNAIGSYVFGLLGARYSRRKLLATIYVCRTLAIITYISLPVTEASTLLFSAVMGFTWLGVLPLVSGLIGRMFGLRDFSMLFGLVFFCHQLGGFLGSWLGGLILDSTGSYQPAWYALVGVGIIATVLQWPMNDRPVPRMLTCHLRSERGHAHGTGALRRCHSP